MLESRELPQLVGVWATYEKSRSLLLRAQKEALERASNYNSNQLTTVFAISM